MRALHKGLLGKQSRLNEGMHNSEKTGRLVMYSVYFLVAVSHFMLLLRSNDEFHKDYEERSDMFIYVHMTLALILDVLAIKRIDVDESNHEEIAHIKPQSPSSRPFSGRFGASGSSRVRKQFSNFITGAEDVDNGEKVDSRKTSLRLSFFSHRRSESTVIDNPVLSDDITNHEKQQQSSAAADQQQHGVTTILETMTT